MSKGTLTYTLRRIVFGDTFTGGELINPNNQRIAYTIEDTDRGLNVGASSAAISQTKRQHPQKTAINAGVWNIGFRQNTSISSINYIDGGMGRGVVPVLDGNGWGGIRFHGGGSSRASAGCIILGTQLPNADRIPSSRAVIESVNKEMINYHLQGYSLQINIVRAKGSQLSSAVNSMGIFSGDNAVNTVADTSAWQSAVDQMKGWYEANIHGYQKQWSVSCPLLGGGKVRDDCSGFVNACLCLYGITTYDTSQGAAAPTSYYMMQDSYAAKLSSSFIRLPYNKDDLQPYDIIVGNAVDGNQHGHTEIYAGNRKSFSWGNIHDLDHGGMPSPTAWTFNNGITYNYIFRCNGSGSVFGPGGSNLTKDDLVAELADKCPKDIAFKGLWMRYHIHAGERSPIIKEIMSNHSTPGGFYGDTSSIAGGPFAGAGAGKLAIPAGFYSDSVLYNFISTAEGNIGVQWVSTDHGHEVVTSAACFGYDFPGGVHDPAYIKLLGLTPEDASGLGITNRGRKPIGGEWYNGRVQWGWYTQPIPASHPYWTKLIPYYRDAMIWAWNQPIIQAVKDPAERLARMHSINWWGHHYLKGFNGGPGWKHRFEMAQRACAGMPRLL